MFLDYKTKRDNSENFCTFVAGFSGNACCPCEDFIIPLVSLMFNLSVIVFVTKGTG